MPVAQIDSLLDIWAVSLLWHSGQLLFASHQDLYNTINSTPLGDIKWESFTVKYTGECPATGAPPWMNDAYEVWFRDPRKLIHSILENHNFTNEMDFQPYQEFETATDKHRFHDFMSGDWAWEQAVSLISCEKVVTDANESIRILLPSMQVHMGQCSYQLS